MPSILIIESDKSLRDTLAEAFSLQGCHVTPVHQAAQGLALAHAHPPAVILCELPHQADYHTFLEKWSTFQMQQPTPLYLLTTDVAAPYTINKIIPPHTRVITKPFNPVELMQICQQDVIGDYAAPA